MDHEICWWFTGFEKGLSTLQEEERSALLRKCAENCLQMGMLDFYRGVHERTGGNINEFFHALGQMGGLETQVVRPGEEYWLVFHQCTCALHTQGYINSSLLCECSRQSVFCILKEFWPDQPFDVTPEGTILEGAQSCRFHITARKETGDGSEI